MRHTTTLFLALLVLFLAGCGGGGGGGDDPLPDPTPDPVLTDSFVHHATAFNIEGATTWIDHVYTNGNVEAVLIVTPNWNPVDGGPMIWCDNAYAVHYDASRDQWGISLAGGADVLPDTSFNVTVATAETTGSVAFYRHVATVGTIDGPVSRIDHSMANGRHDVIVLATRNLDPGGVPSDSHALPFGVIYRVTDSRWSVYNQDATQVMEGAAFNIAILPVGGAGPFADAVVHEASAGDTLFNYTFPGLTLPRDAILHAIPVQNSVLGISTAHGNHFHGVWYDETDTHNWGVFNQDMDDMVLGAAFEVVVCVP